MPYGTSVPVAVWRLRSANCYIRVTLLLLTLHTRVCVASGFEVSGVVDEVCPTVDEGTIKVGDHVIVFPTDEEESTDDGYLR